MTLLLTKSSVFLRKKYFLNKKYQAYKFNLPAEIMDLSMINLYFYQ